MLARQDDALCSAFYKRARAAKTAEKPQEGLSNATVRTGSTSIRLSTQRETVLNMKTKRKQQQQTQQTQQQQKQRQKQQ
ncbi:hypothetical protein EAH_00064070 [Eimeria acervulina]|uniref:Uncharacterized protein n=1 Tax=Eimeria acervulina TaxID=5801 RepID=U6GTP3_EIMAC|nr:hypothetical protein EAH_00064070 [Eimeria acervulina]CDI81969.1 hypothetical protein EAH_00064070 [Eimeria acervulina]